jgi:chromosome segregation ATPase
MDSAQNIIYALILTSPGILALVITLLKHKSDVRRTTSEAKKLDAEAEKIKADALKITNDTTLSLLQPLKDKLRDYEILSCNLEAKVKMLERQVAELKKINGSKDARIAELERLLAAKDARIDDLETEVEDLRLRLGVLETTKEKWQNPTGQ